MKRRLTEFGKYFSKIRKRKKHSLRDASKLLGYSPSHLSAIEHGDREIPRSLLDKICFFYDLTNEERNELYKTVALSCENRKLTIAEIRMATTNMIKNTIIDKETRELALKRNEEMINQLIKRIIKNDNKR